MVITLVSDIFFFISNGERERERERERAIIMCHENTIHFLLDVQNIKQIHNMLFFSSY